MSPNSTEKKYVLAIDQGTTSSRAILFNHDGAIVAVDQKADTAAKLAVFATGPAVRSYGWNVVTEAVGTFVLLAWIIASGKTPSGLGPLAVAMVVVVIGMSLGGPTGYAINPARDLGPRITHTLLPIPGKGDSDWAYSWVPVVGPLIGAVAAGLIVPHVAGLF